MTCVIKKENETSVPDRFRHHCFGKLFALFTVRQYRQLIFKINPQSYEDERRLRSDLEQRSQRLTLELADTKQLIQDGDFRRDNYPSLKR